MPARPSSSPKAMFAELRAVYADLEARPLARTCSLSTGCCHFRQTGRMPLLTRIEALYAAQGVRASGRKKLTPHPEGACPCLGREGRCTIYQHRPFGCRSHFCSAAGGPYPRQHVADLIRRMEEMDEQLGWREGSRSFDGAVAAALEES